MHSVLKSILCHQALREELLNQLQNIVTTEDVDESSIGKIVVHIHSACSYAVTTLGNWVNTLSAVTQNAGELSPNAITSGILVANAVLSSIKSSGISIESVEGDTGGVLASLNNLLSSLNKINSGDRRRLSDLSGTLESVMSVVDSYGLIVAGEMVADQSSISSISSILRSSSRVVASSVNSFTTVVPLTSEESISGLVGSSVNVAYVSASRRVLDSQAGYATQVVTTSVKSKLYATEALKYNSNPLRVYLSLASESDVSSVMLDDGFVEFNFVIQNNGAVSYPVFDNNVTFETQCNVSGLREQFDFLCPNSNLNLVHVCNGTDRVLLSSRCPKSYYAAYCEMIDGPVSDAACNVTSFDEFSTSCTCRFPKNLYFDGRRLRCV